VPKHIYCREVKRVNRSVRRLFVFDTRASVGIGSLIIFIAMILVAGITASVLIQTMDSLQQTAIQTSEEVIGDVSSGLKVTHVSGYNNNSTITQIVIFLTLSGASDNVDLTYTYISLSDSSKKVILSFNSSSFSTSVSNGLFSTLDASNLSATDYGVMVVRDIDNSCSSISPIINNDDLVVLMVNTSACFSGIGPRTEVSGSVIPEHGFRGTIGFTTPSAYIHTIIDLQS
jgi:flagellin FlaB